MEGHREQIVLFYICFYLISLAKVGEVGYNLDNLGLWVSLNPNLKTLLKWVSLKQTLLKKCLTML